MDNIGAYSPASTGRLLYEIDALLPGRRTPVGSSHRILRRCRAPRGRQTGEVKEPVPGSFSATTKIPVIEKSLRPAA